MAHRRSSSRTPPVFTSFTTMRDASRRVANSSSRADNTKNHQNKVVDIWTELLNEGNLIDHPGLSIGSCHLGISSLPLQGSKGRLVSVEAELESTNLSSRVIAWVVSHILITERLVELSVAGGRRPLRFHRAHIRRAGGTG